MKLNEFAALLESGASESEIKRQYSMSNRTYGMMVGKVKRRRGEVPVHQNGAFVPQSLGDLPVERDLDGVYWAGVFDALGQLDVRTKDTITVTARFNTRYRTLYDGFAVRYGGTHREGDGMFAVILEVSDAGLHKLICDLANSQLYADKASKLCQWLEYRFYLAEQERLLVEAFAKS